VRTPPAKRSLEALLSKSFLKSIQYESRRLSRNAKLHISCAHTEPGALRAALEKVASVERRSWVYAKGKPMFATEEGRRFWNSLAQHPESSRHLRIFVLDMDEQPISFSVVLDSGRKRVIVANLYDEQLARHSPGTILTQAVFEDAFARSFDEIEWGQGDSGYKSRWGAVASNTLRDILVLPRTLAHALLGRVIEKRMGFAPPGTATSADVPPSPDDRADPAADGPARTPSWRAPELRPSLSDRAAPGPGSS
jgi:CelD/BcsL family acetyltransferase involved in cellulose biosynthesis